MGAAGRLLVVSLIISLVELVARIVNYSNDVELDDSGIEIIIVIFLFLSWVATAIVYIVIG